MSFEKYTCVFENADKHIKPRESTTFTFDGTGLENADRLFFTGETAISYFWKSEPDYQVLYRRIDDSLRTDKAVHDRFCLDLSGKRVPYTKIAYKRLNTPFKLSYKNLVKVDNEWDFGVFATAKDLKVYGFCRVTLEVRYKKEGVDVAFTADPPDEVFCVDIPQGSYNFAEVLKHASFDVKNTANICYFIEACDYEGELYLEAPFFKNCEGRNILVQFAPHMGDRAMHSWIGQNLSKIEWVDLLIDINGQTVFDGQVFERCHRFSEWEVTLNKGVIRSGENKITFTCLSDFRDAPGYDLREIGFITNNPSSVVAVPENVSVGVPFFVLVDAPKGKEYSFSSDVVEPIVLTCKNDGLNILKFVCSLPANDVCFSLDGEKFKISRCVLREEDGVFTGTGDLIYVNGNDVSHKNYLKWYLSSHIGNLLTIRPTYRWGGTRIVNDDLWRKTANLLDDADMKYVHMLDGRELPGVNCNPPAEVIASKNFLGRQTHEFDGQFSYWGAANFNSDVNTQLFYDLFVRAVRQDPDRCNLRVCKENLYYRKGVKTLYRDPSEPKDMRTACERFINSLKMTRRGVVRNTGPSALFKYFYQAGYEWTGAELMYSSTEITSAALRGASDVYGGKRGAHHAVQWSTSPHDTEGRYRRYRLALFISYIQGLDEINTEEGLWHLEEYYYFHNRFSPACINHTKQQQDFYRYISTHTRSGKFYTPIAFLSGRYDGWRCFARANNIWGREEFGFSDAEKAWDVLTYFYPKSVLSTLYVHDCPDKPVGYYSGTPFGNVDITPVEAEDFNRYRLLVALGYHCAEESDLKKFESFVQNGGTLVIGWPQLSVTVNREDVVKGDHEFLDGKNRTFVSDTFKGEKVSVCDGFSYDSVVLYTDSGRPLVVKKKIGEGELYFITAKEYAGASSVDAAYREILSLLVPTVLQMETVYAEGNENVQFAVYNNEDGSKNVYFIATDWHKEDPSGYGSLIILDKKYDIFVPFGQLVKVAVRGDVALYPKDDRAEVITIDGASATVQGVGIIDFVLLKGGKETTVTIDFSKESVQKILL